MASRCHASAAHVLEALHAQVQLLPCVLKPELRKDAICIAASESKPLARSSVSTFRHSISGASARSVRRLSDIRGEPPLLAIKRSLPVCSLSVNLIWYGWNAPGQSASSEAAIR